MHMRQIDCPDGCECPHCDQYCGALNDLEQELEQTQDYLDDTKENLQDTERELEYTRYLLDSKESKSELRELKRTAEDLQSRLSASTEALVKKNKIIDETDKLIAALAVRHAADIAELKKLYEKESALINERMAEWLTVIKTLRKGPCDSTAPCDLVENGAEGTYVCSYHDYAD